MRRIVYVSRIILTCTLYCYFVSIIGKIDWNERPKNWSLNYENYEMKSYPSCVTFSCAYSPIFFLVKNRSAGEISCGSHCVNKIGQIMKFISYSNG